ncbi:MAG: MBOAT family protein [Lachnospiraceae bacterium]|nr:MBOAT family protein [Lachnospiraceae bacterium]
MTFTTMAFAIFMAVTFILYYLVPGKFQWIVLLAANGYFYYQTGWKSAVFLFATILVSYGMGILIEKTGQKRYVIAGTLLLFVALLCVMRLPFASVIMPLGLSFYALQCIGYCIEVYRQSVPAEKNPLKYALYISFFPHVLQGPFADYKELQEQLLAPHAFDYDKAVRGCLRIGLGLMKKLVIADRIGYVVDKVYETGDGYYGATVLLVMILYSIQLYTDFSGYMDMATGSASLLGIEIRENFNVPYASKSMAEFWRRWHISLGLWFKNYVFYPVLRTELCSGIRKKMKAKKNRYAMNTFPTVIALTVVWTLIGLWHGFDWNYLCYDWFCGLIIISAELLKPVYDKVNQSAPKIFQSKWMDGLRILRTFLLVSFSFLFFRPDTIEITVTMMKNLFQRPNLYAAAEFIYWNIYDLFLITLPLIILGVIDGMKYKEMDVYEKFHRLPAVARWAVYICGILLVYIAKGDMSGTGFAYYVF